MKRIATTLAAVVLAAVAFTACAVDTNDDVCDEYEATDYGDDCGYWVDDGSGTAVWVWYVWVTPYKGGTPKNGQKPTPPPGTKVITPPKNKPPLPPGVKKPAAPPKPPANPPKPPPPPKGKK